MQLFRCCFVVLNGSFTCALFAQFSSGIKEWNCHILQCRYFVSIIGINAVKSSESLSSDTVYICLILLCVYLWLFLAHPSCHRGKDIHLNLPLFSTLPSSSLSVSPTVAAASSLFRLRPFVFLKGFPLPLISCEPLAVSETLQAPHPTALIYSGCNSIMFFKTHTRLDTWLRY